MKKDRVIRNSYIPFKQLGIESSECVELSPEELRFMRLYGKKPTVNELKQFNYYNQKCYN